MGTSCHKRISWSGLSVWPCCLCLVSILSVWTFFPSYSSAAEVVIEADSSTIILSSEPTEENQLGYSNAVILPLQGGGSIMALRTVDTGEAAYTFSLVDANLVALLQALAESMLPPVEITESPYSTSTTDFELSSNSAPTVAVKTALAYILNVTFEVADADILETLDQAAIASGCNIYLDDRLIVVDRC